MLETTSKSSRIALNTVLLYARMIIIMIINLVSVRIVLKELGLVDYGVYNVVAGIITMLSSVSSVLATATQRYYSYYIGQCNSEKLYKVFASSINIYFLLSVFVVLIGETLGLWFVNNQLVIPEDRLYAANYVYQLSIFSFIFTILQLPFSAAVISHEDMGIYAIVTSVEAILKLLLAVILFKLINDNLIAYAWALFLVHLAVFIAYCFVSSFRYSECRYTICHDRTLYKELLSFSGWTLFGSIASVCMIQGNTLLVNMYFGPVVNASRAIALQVFSAISTFANSFIMAIRPPIIKAYSEHDYMYLGRLFNSGNKFIYYCLLMICLPLYIDMEYILNIWLNCTNQQAILFSRLILIYTLVLCLGNPITIIIQATGKVKEYHLAVESFTLLCLPITYVLFRLGLPASATFYAMIVNSLS